MENRPELEGDRRGFSQPRISQGQRRLGRVGARSPSESVRRQPDITDPQPVLVSQGLRGLTADEVRTRLGGKPDRVNYRRHERPIDRAVDLSS